MNNRFTKIISSLLIMASVICAVPVFASASDEGASSSSNNGITTIYNRTFDDGWDAGNGGYFAGNSGIHYCGLAEEPSATGINRYMSMTLVSSLSGGCYYQMNVPTGTVGASDEHIMEFDIRSDGMSGPNTLSLLYARIGPNSSDDVTILRRTPDNKFQFVFGTTVNIATKLPSEWMHIGLKFSVDRAKGTLTVSCYADGVYIASGTITKASLIPTLFRFQVVSTGGDAGDNISFDNIKYYVGTSEFTELAEDDYGVLVNTSVGKTLSSTVSGKKSFAQCVADAYVMKVGTKRALKAGKKVNIFDGPLAGQYGEPVVIDGEVYVPLVPILDHMGFQYSVAGRSSVDIAIATKDPESGAVTTGVVTLHMGKTDAVVSKEIVKLTGAPGSVNTGLYYTDDSGNEVEASYLVVAMNDIEKLFPGWYITYDAMGFIMLAEADEIYSRDTDLRAMVNLMKEFVYDYPAADTILKDLSEATNNFDHPYLYGNDDDFEFLRSIYNKEYLLADGTPNTEFLAENKLTLEDAELLRTMVYSNVNSGISWYVSYVVPDITVDGNPNYFFDATGNKFGTYNESKMYDSDGNFIYPYDDSVRGEGKVVFAPMFTNKKGGGGTMMWDYVEDDYVVALSISGVRLKKNYIYDAATDSYIDVGEGNGIYDYVSYGFVDLKQPEKNYKYNEATSSYEKVASGTGTHDLVGTDADGNDVYAVLRTPKNDYARYNRGIDSLYAYAFPFIDYFTFDTDPTDPETYLEVNKENPTLCMACNVDHFGYDCIGARQGSPAIGHAKFLAFAYMITGELNYARLAYDLLDIMGNWPHWGPAHALNMCEAAGEYGLALDWVYDAVVMMSENGETNYKGEPMSIKVLEEHLWEHGVGEDYVMSVMGEKTAYLRDETDKPGIIADMSSFYADNENNWGNVCNANIALAAMSLLSYTDTISADTNFVKVYSSKGVKIPTGGSYQTLTAQVLENKFWCLPYFASYSYVPDGVYSESPGYWSYGTNEFMFMITALYNILGHTYSMIDAPGYDKTFAYVVQMETVLSGTKFVNFNYNDGGMGSSDTSYFFTAALVLNQPELASLRFEHLRRGKSKSFADIFMFRDALEMAERVGDVDLALDYEGKVLDLYTTRSSWDDSRPLFAGIMGGQSSMNHGHLDNGSWVYYDEGVTWVIDPGSESYNVYSDTDYPSTGDWDPVTKTMKLHHRYRYYRLSAEGHNTFVITSRQSTLPYGQNAQGNAYSHMMEIGDSGKYHYSDENGSFVKYDMSAIYTPLSGEKYVTEAYRGMLLTNGRRTLVIQDEVDFVALESFAWSAHVDLSSATGPANYKISADKKTVYLYSGGDAVCRMTLVLADGQDEDLYGFDVLRTNGATGERGVYLLDATHPIDSHLEYNGDTQHSRDGLKNIVVRPKNSGGVTSVGSVKMAVVLESFENIDVANVTPVGYQYCPMSEWETYEFGRYSDAEIDTELRDTPGMNDFNEYIYSAADNLAVSLEYYKIYEIKTFDVYMSLANACWSIKGLQDKIAESDKETVELITSSASEYDSYVGRMNEKMILAAAIAEKLDLRSRQSD